MTAINVSESAAIIRMLEEIIKVQQAELDLIRQIHLAATKPIDDSSPVNAALKSLVLATNNQTQTMDLLLKQMENLPKQLGAALGDQVERVLRNV